MHLPLEFLRDKVSPDIVAYRSHRIKRSASPSSVHRVTLEYRDGCEDGPRVLIVKAIAAEWPGDAEGALREVRFYLELAPRLNLPSPRLYYAGAAPGASGRLIVMESIAHSHFFPSPEYRWSAKEAEAILRTYARLHDSGYTALPTPEERGWLYPRYEERVIKRADELSGMVEAITGRGVWQPLRGFSHLLATTLRGIETFAGTAATVLHNDVYPPNAALPRDPGTREVILVDWEMVGWGLPELDLAFMFHQPFHSHRNLEREEALAFYWRERERLGGEIPTGAERHARQEHADRLLALWLLPVAHEVVMQRPASPWIRRYWASMITVLEQSLVRLCHTRG